MKYSLVSWFAVGAAVWMAAAMPARAQTAPVLEYTTVGADTFAANESIGWSFTVNTPVLVIALDALAGASPGNVRLYNAAGMLANATLNAGDAKEGAPTLFYTTPITPIALAPGTYYIAENALANATTADAMVSDLTTNPAITYTGAVFVAGLGQNPRTDANGGTFNPAFFGPNFDIAGAPEPSPLVWAVLLGVVAMATRLRRSTSPQPSYETWLKL